MPSAGGVAFFTAFLRCVRRGVPSQYLMRFSRPSLGCPPPRLYRTTDRQPTVRRIRGARTCNDTCARACTYDASCPPPPKWDIVCRLRGFF